MVHFNGEFLIVLTCDISVNMVGAILAHKMPDGSERPVRFASHSYLVENSKDYRQIEKEAKVCIVCLMLLDSMHI